LVADWEDEVEKIRRALLGSRSVLNQVNQAKADFENYERMLEIQRKLDKSSFEKSDHPISKQYRVTPFSISTTRWLVFLIVQ
jgi:hypothetical protein